jgi:class 3 adenylate cyclase
MAVAGVPVAQPGHAEACANLALGILETIKAFNQRNQLDWHVRVGVHSGPLVAGIIGTKKFSYDLWGDTVNIASRMQSQGAPGCIQISATTRDLLPDRFLFAERGTLEMKNRGPMAVYHLQARK